MPDWIKFPLVLTAIGLVSAIALSGLYTSTLSQKEIIKSEQMKKSLSEVLPLAKEFELVEKKREGLSSYYVAKDETGKIMGYAIKGQAEGYGGPIELVVGVDKLFVISGIKIFSQKETPGLGDKIVEVFSKKTWKTVLTGTSPDEGKARPYFQSQFENKKVPLALKKDGGDIEAITGATISSQAVVNAVNTAVLKLRRQVTE